MAVIDLIIIDLPCAYRLNICEKLPGTSLTYNRKSREPTIVPCGTPLLKVFHAEAIGLPAEFAITHCLLLEGYITVDYKIYQKLTNMATYNIWIQVPGGVIGNIPDYKLGHLSTKQPVQFFIPKFPTDFNKK